jgi:two-component system, OmpR family, KDP operon response regulator KdpE
VSMCRRLLVVEDQQSIRRVIELSLAARSYQVDVAATGAAALSLARRRGPDLIILDLGLPDMDGLAVITAVRAFSAAPIVVISARDSGPAEAAAMAAGADGFLAKPFGMDDLVALVRAAGCPAALAAERTGSQAPRPSANSATR